MSGLTDTDSLDDANQFLDPLDLFGGQAARSGERLAEEASIANIDELRRQFDIGQQRLAPFQEQAIPAIQLQSALSGARGLESQLQAYEDFQNSPATQFLIESGLKMAGPQSGELGRELNRYAGGLAMQDFGNTLNRIAQVAGTGQTSQFDLAGLGAEASRDIVNQQQQLANIQNQANLNTMQGIQSGIGTGLGLAAAGGLFDSRGG